MDLPAHETRRTATNRKIKRIRLDRLRSLWETARFLRTWVNLHVLFSGGKGKIIGRYSISSRKRRESRFNRKAMGKRITYLPVSNFAFLSEEAVSSSTNNLHRSTANDNFFHSLCTLTIDGTLLFLSRCYLFKIGSSQRAKHLLTLEAFSNQQPGRVHRFPTCYIIAHVRRHMDVTHGVYSCLHVCCFEITSINYTCKNWGTDLRVTNK